MTLKALPRFSDIKTRFGFLLIGETALQELKHAMSHNNLLMSGLVVAKHFQADMNVASSIAQIEDFIIRSGKYIASASTPQEKLNQFVDFFYKDLAFSGDERDFFASKYNLINQVIDFRTGIPVSMAMIFCQVGNAIGLKLSGVNFPGHFLVRCELDAEKTVFIDPLNGSRLNWQKLQQLYSSILGESAEESMPVETLDAVGVEETVIRLLHNLKSAYINEENYQDALATVDLLVQLCPDDPYERRDRGFLLHQLECPTVALADYEYFIKHCPKDPSTPLLKIQLKQLQQQSVILH